MDNPKLAELVRALITKTATGSLAWERTAESDIFQVTIGTNTVRIWKGPGAEDALAYWVSIFGPDGEMVDSVNDEEISNEIPHAFSAMERMFLSARSKALELDKVVDEILDALEYL